MQNIVMLFICVWQRKMKLRSYGYTLVAENFDLQIVRMNGDHRSPQLVEKVAFDKLSDCREMCKMAFSSSQRRTEVLREGEKRSSVKV